MYACRMSPSHRRSKAGKEAEGRRMRILRGGLGRPRRLSSLSLLSVGLPRDQHAPVETGEILGWASWRAEERRETERAMRWSQWDSSSQFGPRLPSCMTCRLLSNSLYSSFQPEPRFRVPRCSRGQRRDPASWVRELSRSCTTMSAPGFPAGLSAITACVLCSLVPDPG